MQLAASARILRFAQDDMPFVGNGRIFRRIIELRQEFDCAAFPGFTAGLVAVSRIDRD